MIRLQSCYGPVIEELMAIKGDAYRVGKFSFFHYGELDYLDVYLLGMRFQYGIDFQMDLDIARNCYEYCHHRYNLLYNNTDIFYEQIQSPTYGTSLLNYVLLNESLKRDTSFYDDKDADDDGEARFQLDQLTILSAASLNFQQKWCLPYLDEISEYEKPEIDETNFLHVFFLDDFNNLLTLAKEKWRG